MSWDTEFAEPIDLPNKLVRHHPSPSHWIYPPASRCRAELPRMAARPPMCLSSCGSGRIYLVRAHRDYAGPSTTQGKSDLIGLSDGTVQETRLEPGRAKAPGLVSASTLPRAAAEALSRGRETVRAKARMIGCPFLAAMSSNVNGGGEGISRANVLKKARNVVASLLFSFQLALGFDCWASAPNDCSVTISRVLIR